MERLRIYKATFTNIGIAGNGLFYIRDVKGIEEISPDPIWVAVDNDGGICHGKTGRVVGKDNGVGLWALEFENGTRHQFYSTGLRRATDEEIAAALPKWTAKRQSELDGYSTAELLEAIGRKTTTK